MAKISGNESNNLVFMPKDRGKTLDSQELIVILRGIFQHWQINLMLWRQVIFELSSKDLLGKFLDKRAINLGCPRLAISHNEAIQHHPSPSLPKISSFL